MLEDMFLKILGSISYSDKNTFYRRGLKTYEIVCLERIIKDIK